MQKPKFEIGEKVLYRRTKVYVYVYGIKWDSWNQEYVYFIDYSVGIHCQMWVNGREIGKVKEQMKARELEE